MIEAERIRLLNDDAPDRDGAYVLYWMQNAQRASFNPALEHAIRIANEEDLPVIVGFGLMADYPEANERHFAFMLEGLREVAETLSERGIKLVVLRGEPDEVALRLSRSAFAVVCDRGYLRHQRRWRLRVAREAGKRVVQVEGDVVVPVACASDRLETAARTLRPKLQRQWHAFLGDVHEAEPMKSSLRLRVKGDIDPRRPESVLTSLDLDRDVGRVGRFRAGTTEARRLLARFLRSDLPGYRDARNDPSDPQCSNLSPYLHFGQISPVEVARKVVAAKGGTDEDDSSFLDELIVRRELAVNYVMNEPHYDAYRGLPAWARETLEKHKHDTRPHVYTRAELESANTHDPYWNAAMNEMRKTGYMHNHMRMYWGKKIIEWTNTPEYAFSTTLHLNNRYFLDGRDPNSFANVAWLFGLHDRGWPEREVFGKVRYMNDRGLERKFDIGAYVDWVASLPEP